MQKKSTIPKYYESKTTFENGNVYNSGDLYGTEEEFWADCADGKILFVEDVSLPFEQNLPDESKEAGLSE